ncbi:hypothetical protein ABIE67_001294 [Streptomyces sp. V4I8]
MDAELFPRERTEVAPGAVHVPDWLDPGRQRELLAAAGSGRGHRPGCARSARRAAAP